MISSERRDELLQYIAVKGFVTVAELAEKMHTSSSTVRRDLDELQRLGYIRRTHGGAESIQELKLPITTRRLKNRAQKIEVARKAVELLGDARLIFVDNSSTAQFLGSFLPKTGIAVWTNGIELATMLGAIGVRVLSTGGELLNNSLAFVGGHAIETIAKINFDAMFFSSSGIDSAVVSDWSEQETLLRRAALAQSKRRYFLCDTSKIGNRSEYKVCSVSYIDAVVTEHGIYTPETLFAKQNLPDKN